MRTTFPGSNQYFPVSRCVFCFVVSCFLLLLFACRYSFQFHSVFSKTNSAISGNIDRERWPFFRESHVTRREEKDCSRSRSKISPAKGKGKEKKERVGKERMKKVMVALLVFILVALKTVYGPKTLYDTWKRSKIRLDMPYSKVVTKIRPTHFRTFFKQFPETLQLLYSLLTQGCKHHRVRAQLSNNVHQVFHVI